MHAPQVTQSQSASSAIQLPIHGLGFLLVAAGGYAVAEFEDVFLHVLNYVHG